MFALWYGVLTYQEYKDAIWEKIWPKKKDAPKETAVVCPLPPKKAEPSKIPLIEPPKTPPRTPTTPRTPSSPLTPRSSSPQTPPLAHSTPFSTPTKSSQAVEPQKPKEPIVKPLEPLAKPLEPVAKPLEPPAKPPRSPSPHPIRAEAFEDIEYDEEEEEEEESSDVEEDDENSVIASSSPRRAPVSNSVNEFINQEINTQQNSVRLNQTR